MSTPLLYHGPMARDNALQKAQSLGRLISEPIGDGGLKVADSRQVVVLSQNSGVGDDAPSVIIGPLCQATPEAADALLKTLEDLAEGPLKITLWAHHLSSVIGTIRSRTLPIWCPPSKTYTHPSDYMLPEAKRLLEAVKQQDELQLLEVLSEPDNKKYYDQLIQAFVKVLCKEVKSNPTLLRFWPDIRDVLSSKGSYLQGVKVFLKNMESC